MATAESEENSEIRSLNADEQSFVKFINRSCRKVALFWHNYSGKLVRYAILEPGGIHMMDTFVTHPWSVTDSESGDTLKIDDQYVFFPRPPPNEGARMYETVYIDLPVYPLWIRCLQTLRQIVARGNIDNLQIPSSLKHALKYVPDIKYTNYQNFAIVTNER